MKKLLLILFISLGLIGNTFALSKEEQVKKFDTPGPNKSGIYIYREDLYKGRGIQPKILINDECIGKLKIKMFFYKEVDANETLTIYTKSDWTGNDELVINTENEELYFVEVITQEGFWTGKATVELRHKNKGMQEVFELDMANVKNCN